MNYVFQSSNNWCDRPSRLIKSPSASLTSKTMQQQQHHAQTFSSASIRQGSLFTLALFNFYRQINEMETILYN